MGLHGLLQGYLYLYLYSTHKVFSSQSDFQLHRTAHNNSDASVPQFNSSAPKLISWPADVSKLNCLSVSISSQSSSAEVSRDSLNSPLSPSQSHNAIDSQSDSKSSCPAPSGAHDQIFISIWQLRYCFCREPSLTIERVCLLYMLLALASAVFLGSESFGSHDYILLSQNWDFPFRRLLRHAGSRWRYSTPPPHGYLHDNLFI
jgi:hypothetical protein